MRPYRWLLILLGVLVSSAAVGSCGRDQTVLISVASSLTESFEQIESDLEDQNPDLEVKVNVAGSATLVRQIDGGASVDIVALADREAADSLATPTFGQSALTSNWLVVVQQADMPELLSLDQLADSSLIISACDTSLPCGRLTERVLVGEGAPIEVDTRETNVRAVRERVVSGEADIGFIYISDGADLASTVVVAPIDLSSYQNEAVAVLLSDGVEARKAYDFIVDYFATAQITAGLPGS